MEKNGLVFLGILLGLIVGIFSLNYLYKAIPFLLNLSFLGVIIANYPIRFNVNLHVQGGNNKTLKKILLFTIGFVIVFGLSFLNQASFDINYNKITLASLFLLLLNGIFVAVAMILPGISGALMLVILGLYFPLLESISNVILSVTSLIMPSGKDVMLVLLFGSSFLIGLIISAKIIQHLMKKKTKEMELLINGMIFGSIVNMLLQVPFIETSKIEIFFGILFMSMIIFFLPISKKGPILNS